MKRLLSIIAIISVVFIHNIDSNNIIFQDEMETTEVQDTQVDSSMEVEEVVEEMEEPAQLNFHQELNTLILPQVEDTNLNYHHLSG